MVSAWEDCLDNHKQDATTVGTPRVGLHRLSMLRTMYAQVPTAWNFLNPLSHDQDQLVSHGEERLQKCHGTRHHLQLSVR